MVFSRYLRFSDRLHPLLGAGKRHWTGWLWELSPTQGLVQSALVAGPGMVIKVSVQIPGVALMRLEGLVTWARVSECGLEWLYGPAALTEKGVGYETPR